MRIFLTLLLLTIFAQGLFSQVSLGVRARYSECGVHFEPRSLNDDQVTIKSPNLGVIFTYVNQANAGLQFELNYTRKGWREKLKEDKLAYFQRNVSYLELAVLSHFEIGQKKLRILIILGPCFGWKLGESVDKNNFDNIIAGSEFNHYEQKIRDLNIGIRGALGVRYNISDKIGIFSEFGSDIQVVGGRDIFNDKPNGIDASRLNQLYGTFGIIWHIRKQEKKEEIIKYQPKEDLYEVL